MLRIHKGEGTLSTISFDWWMVGVLVEWLALGSLLVLYLTHRFFSRFGLIMISAKLSSSGIDLQRVAIRLSLPTILAAALVYALTVTGIGGPVPFLAQFTSVFAPILSALLVSQVINKEEN